MYDQSGATNCSGLPCDFVWNTTRPTLTWNSGNPYMQCLNTGLLQTNAITTSNPSPFTYSTVMTPDPADNLSQMFYSFAGTTAAVDAVTPNTISVYAGTLAPTTGIAAGVFHGLQAVFNGASSDLNVNGTTNTINPGAAAPYASGTQLRVCDAAGLTRWKEGGVWSVGFSGSQSTAMNSNQQAFWGY
jgi:hypothetical protein